MIFQKGFPLETTLDEIEGWLKGKGAIENIQMRRNFQKNFKVIQINFIIPPGGNVFDHVLKRRYMKTQTKQYNSKCYSYTF